MSFSISGKTAIITGAADGIGLAIARHLADRGANVMCADSNEKKLMEELGDTPDDGNVRVFAGDLRQRLTIANLVSATIDAYDQVDILVNASRQVLPTDPLDIKRLAHECEYYQLKELQEKVASLHGGPAKKEADSDFAK